MTYRPFLALVALLVLAPPAQPSAQPLSIADARDPDVLAELIEGNRDQFELVDVRTDAEYRSGHIPTAVNVDYRVIGERFANRDRSVPVVVYCRSGNRSGRAARTLRALGFNVVDFGGINRWDRPVERGG